MPKRILAALSVMLVANSFTVAQRKRLPQFGDYRVAGARNEIGKIIGIDRGDYKETPAQFRKRVRAAANSGPNFAGHLAIVGVSCGMICLNLFLVDVATKRIHDFPFLGIADGPCPRDFYKGSPILADFRTNSRLIVFRGSTEEAGPEGVQDQPCSYRYYVWRNNRLVLLRKIVVR